jgi:peptidoglycan/LPS O-acetylase OafA/YrhL
VISGFLVAASRERSATIGSFLHKRALRILPGFTLVCLLSVFVLGPALTVLPLDAYFDHPQARIYFVNLTMFDVQLALPGVFGGNVYPHAVNGSTWTLPIECFMYLLLAVGGILLRYRWRMLAVALAAIVAFHSTRSSGPAAARTCGRRCRVLHRQVRDLLCAGNLRLPVARTSCRCRRSRRSFCGRRVRVAQHGGGDRAVHAGAVVFDAGRRGAAVAVLTGFGRWGDFSYGMYLFAFPVQQTIVHFAGPGLSQPLNIAICFGVTLCLAALSWHLVERPALELKSSPRPRH